MYLMYTIDICTIVQVATGHRDLCLHAQWCRFRGINCKDRQGRPYCDLHLSYSFFVLQNLQSLRLHLFMTSLFCNHCMQTYRTDPCFWNHNHW